MKTIQRKAIDFSYPYTDVRTILRGRLVCLDRLMSGTLRFATKVGNEVQLLSPLTSDITTQIHEVGDTYVAVSNVINIPSGSRVHIYNFPYIVDYFDSETNRLYLTYGLREQIPNLTPVKLAGYPVTVRGNYYEGSQQLVLQCDQPIYSLDLVNIGKETFSVTQSNPVANNGYDCLLDSPLSVAAWNGEMVYLTATPHFESGPIYLTPRMGVLILDSFNGSHLSDIKSQLAVSVEFYNANGNLIDTLNVDSISDEPLFNLYAPIYPENLVMSNFLTPGDLDPTRHFIINPINGYGGIQINCNPPIPNIQVSDWLIRAKGYPGEVLIYSPYPNSSSAEYTFTSNSWEEFKVPGPKRLSKPINHLLFSMRGTHPITIAEVTPNRIASYIIYSMVMIGDVLPNHARLATGILAKPEFLSIEEMTALVDIAETDSGYLV